MTSYAPGQAAREIKVLSLFSGIGGFDIGLERAGMKVIGQVEIDPFCNRVLAEHWPNVRRYGDVRSIGKPEGRSAPNGHAAPVDDGWREAGAGIPGSVDLICGGFPCQDLSVAGKRAGLDGERSGLWFEFKRVLSELRPTWAIIENVPGLLSSSGGRDFGIVLSGLAECGFAGVGWRVLDSRFFGVAQRRRRVFIVGGPSRGSVAQVLSLCESCTGDSQTVRTAGKDVAGTIKGSARGSGTDNSAESADRLIAAPLTHSGRGTERIGESRGQDTLIANSLLGQGGRRQLEETYVPALDKPVLERDGKGVSQREGVTTLIAHSLRSDGFDASEDGTGPGTPLVAAFSENQRAETLETDYSHQLTSGGGKPGQGYPAVRIDASVRRLTPTECERLQGFPDGWTALEGAADGPRYRALGNAVTVSVIEYLGRRILAVRP